MTGHPDPDVLNGFADGDLSRELRSLVAGHLENCTECRKAVLAYRNIGERFRALPPEPLPEGIKDRVLASIESGAKVVLPRPSREGAGSRRPRSVWRAAAVVAVAVGVAVVIGSPELSSEYSDLAFNPPRPGAGQDISVVYRGGGRFAGEDRLVLRGRFRRSGQSRDEVSSDPPQQVVAVLERGDDRLFQGSFALPTGVVYAAFAVEDESGSTIDANNGLLWDLLVHENGVPSFDALAERRSDVETRAPLAGLAAARMATELFPDRPEAWMWLAILERSTLGIARADSVRAEYLTRYPSMDSALALRDDVPLSSLLAMFYLARDEVGDSAAAYRWKERILRDAPESSEAVEVLIDDILFGEPGRSRDAILADLEDLWNRVPEAMIVPAAYFRASLAGNPDALLRWTERYETLRSTKWPDLVEGLLAIPSLQEIGIAKARAYLAHDPIADEGNRLLHERRADHQWRVARAQRRVNLLLGRALISRGALEEGRAALEQAESVSWDRDVFISLAGARLATGDTLGALEVMSQAAVDPLTSSEERDSLARTAGGMLRDGEWNRLVDQARRRMWGRVAAEGLAGETIPDSAMWMDSADEWHGIRDVLNGRVTLVLFHDLAGDLDASEVAEKVAGLGGITVALIATPRSLTDTTWVRALFEGVPVFYDMRGQGRRVFRFPGFPSYAVVDQSARIRFASLYDSLDDALRQVAMLVAIGDTPAIAE